MDCEGGCAFHHLVCAPFLHISQHGPFSHVMLNDVKFYGRAAYQDAVCADFFLDLDGLLVLVNDDMCSSPYWNVSEFQASCGSVHSGNSQRGKEDTKSKATSQSPLVSSIPQVWFESFGDKSLFSVVYWLLAGVVVSTLRASSGSCVCMALPTLWFGEEDFRPLWPRGTNGQSSSCVLWALHISGSLQRCVWGQRVFDPGGFRSLAAAWQLHMWACSGTSGCVGCTRC